MRQIDNENKKRGEDLGNETRVGASFPSELKLNMVQANELRHYELFQWLVVLLLSIAIGFWTAHFTLNQT